MRIWIDVVTRPGRACSVGAAPRRWLKTRPDLAASLLTVTFTFTFTFTLSLSLSLSFTKSLTLPFTLCPYFHCRRCPV